MYWQHIRNFSNIDIMGLHCIIYLKLNVMLIIYIYISAFAWYLETLLWILDPPLLRFLTFTIHPCCAIKPNHQHFSLKFKYYSMFISNSPYNLVTLYCTLMAKIEEIHRTGHFHYIGSIIHHGAENCESRRMSFIEQSSSWMLCDRKNP